MRHRKATRRLRKEGKCEAAHWWSPIRFVVFVVVQPTHTLCPCFLEITQWCHRVKVQDQPPKSRPALTPDAKKSEVPTETAQDPSPGTSKATLPSEGKKRIRDGIAVISEHIFAENVRPPIVVTKLPEPDERLANTPQLACCLGLLKD